MNKLKKPRIRAHITKTKFCFKFLSMACINKHISTCFFLLSFGYYLALPIHGETLSAPPHYQVVNVSSLLPKPYCQGSTSGPTIGSQKLKIISRFGPCNSKSSRTKIPSSDQLLNWDQTRVRSINKRVNGHYSNSLSEDEHKGFNPIPIYEGNDHGEYVVTIGLGTPQQNYNLIMDTGSHLTWVRCQSCSKGCKSEDPLYDPLKSSTYTNSTSCNGPFNSQYGDGSYTNAIWGCDTLTIDGFGAIKNFRFGCGQKNIDKISNFEGAAGILGLGKGDFSLQSQSNASNLTSMQVFSYCFPVTSSHVGNLYLGDEAKRKSYNSPIQSIPLVKGDKKELYYVDLVGISVAGKKLNILTTRFTRQGTIIDSGTVITRLPQVVYAALRDAFRKSMSNYTLSENADDKLDTCYNKEEQVILPEITFHFGKRTKVTLSKYGSLWIRRDEKVMCLAFAPTEDSEGPSIIGNVQQRGLNVVYDLKGGKIGFGISNCDG